MFLFRPDGSCVTVPSLRGVKLLGVTDGAWQRLAFSFHVTSDVPLQLVLPLPVALGAGPDDLRLVELGDSERLWCFQALVRGFPGARERIHDVVEPHYFAGETSDVLYEQGAGEAWGSFPLTLTSGDDPAQLGRETEVILDAMPSLHDWGSARMTIPAGKWEARTTALAFKTRWPGTLYLPTMHSTCEVGAIVEHDHYLFFQGGDPPRLSGRSLEAPRPEPARPPAVVGPPRRSTGPAGAFAPELAGLVDPHACVHRLALTGKLPNDMLWVEAG